MKIKNLFAVAALLMASASAFAQHVISPVTLVDNQGINYNVVEVYKTENPSANQINTVTVAITNDFSGATLNIPDEVTLTLNAGSKDENATPIEGAFKFRVIAIQEDAFRNNRNITTVNIGKYVANIAANAFNSCTGVTAINFAEGSALTALGAYCFGNMPKLTTLSLDNCASLTDITQGWAIGAATAAAGVATPFHTSAANPVNNYLKTLKLNKVQTIGTQLASLTALESVEFTELTALVANAFNGDEKLTSLEIPAKCINVANGALTGAKVATLTINCNQTAGAQTIGSGAAIDANDNITTINFVGEFKGNIGNSAFTGDKVASVTFGAVSGTIGTSFGAANKALKTLTFGEMKAGASIAAGAFIIGESATVTFGKISHAAFNTNADIITGNGTKAATLTIGDINAAISQEIISNKVGAVTTGVINANVDVMAFGTATGITFGEIKTGSSVTSTAAVARTNLKEVTFSGAVAANGVGANAFVYESKLETVNFNGLLAAGAVVTGSFGTAVATQAGSAVTQTATRTWYLTVNYKPSTYTNAFAVDAFATAAAAPNMVKLVSNMTFTGDSRFATFYGVGGAGFFNVLLSFEGETREIEMLTVSGQSTWYGKFVADGCNYAIPTTNADGKKVVVYEAYLDENATTQITSIVMLPLTRDANYYIVKAGQAVIVRAWGEGNITAEATTASDTQNYYDVAGAATPKNVIKYYEQGTSYNYLDVSVDASVLNDACLAGGYSYMYAVKNLATNAFQWGQFQATAGLMPKYTLYVYTHFQGENPASGRLNIIWADGEDGEATAIETVKSAAEDGEMFNLAGQKVGANFKGVVIKNGKKVILK